MDERVIVDAHTISLSSGKVGSNSATLTLNHHEGAWSYQGGQGAGQAQAGRVTGTVASVSGDGVGLWPPQRAKARTSAKTCPPGNTPPTSRSLTPDTEYTWKAYKAAGCQKGAEIASTSFTGPATAGTHPPTGEEPDQAEDPGGRGGGGPAADVRGLHHWQPVV